jgi:hypothetical protein
MKTSTNRAWNFRPAISKIGMALACISVIGSMAATPALAKDNDKRIERHDNGLHKGDRRGDRDWQRGYQQPYRYQHPYVYAQPVYAPPPVYYAPQPSPGITLFFPLEIRVR